MSRVLLDREQVLKITDPDGILPDWVRTYWRTKVMELRPVKLRGQAEPDIEEEPVQPTTREYTLPE